MTLTDPTCCLPLLFSRSKFPSPDESSMDGTDFLLGDCYHRDEAFGAAFDHSFTNG